MRGLCVGGDAVLEVEVWQRFFCVDVGPKAKVMRQADEESNVEVGNAVAGCIVPLQAV